MKPLKQQRESGLSNAKRTKPKGVASATFGNAGIEPTKSKARLASSQMHVFREARTQERHITKQAFKSSSQQNPKTLLQRTKPNPTPLASQVMSSFFKRDSSASKREPVCVETKTIPRVQRGDINSACGEKRGRESASSITERKLARSSSSITYLSEKNDENYSNKSIISKISQRKLQLLMRISIKLSPD